MKKKKKAKIRNFVAKNLNKINKPSVHKDKSKYSRKKKHKEDKDE